MDSASEGITMEVIIIGMSLMFIFTLALIVFFVVYQKRLLNQENALREKELRYQKELLRASIEGQEQERLRIAKDLHDDIGTMLTTAKVYFEQFSTKNDEESREKLSEKMNQILGGTIQSVREISHDLRPVILEKLGLIEAIEALSETLNESGEIHVEFSNQGMLNFTKEQNINLYRIIQELVTNTLKHGKANQIFIELNTADNQLTLLYEDDGIGVNPSLLDTNKGIGLKNIESRLSLISGNIKYHNQPFGFHVEIQVALSGLP